MTVVIALFSLAVGLAFGIFLGARIRPDAVPWWQDYADPYEPKDPDQRYL